MADMTEEAPKPPMPGEWIKDSFETGIVLERMTGESEGYVKVAVALPEMWLLERWPISRVKVIPAPDWWLSDE
jgi:hypothetical protein